MNTIKVTTDIKLPIEFYEWFKSNIKSTYKIIIAEAKPTSNKYNHIKVISLCKQ